MEWNFVTKKGCVLIRVLIIDDEPEVRDLLSILLRDYPGLEVVGLASDVDEAIRITLDKKPDLVLLDIQMPGKDGFTYLEELRSLQLYPGIIFVTAYENYAIRAIRNAAFDYLLKPIRKEELFRSISRFTEYLDRDKKDEISRLIQLLSKSKPGRIRLNTRTGYFFVDPQDIMYIEADGNYSHIRLTTGKTEITTMSLGNIEKLVEESSFLRISRSYIINMKYISKVDRRDNICELENDGVVHRIKFPSKKIRLLEGYF
jgi:two-component system LytT family response regulator